MSFSENARPFLTLHVGQAGVQIGNAIWELLCLEHNIQKCGLAKPDCPTNGFYDAMFLRNQNGHFMPRSIFLDTDPTCIDEIRVGPYRELFSTRQLLSDHTDAGFNYMRGRRDFNRNLLPEAVERFRWLSEKSDVTPTAFLIHSTGGGTGSGLSVSYLEGLRAEFDSRIQVLELSVSSGHSGLQSTCELVNSMLCSYESKDYTSLSFSVTNSAMFNLCRSGLGLYGGATFAHVNRMLAMCFSNLTAMERFPGTVMCNIANICSNVLPFRQLKHPILACAPFAAASTVGKERTSAIGITSAVMEPDGQLADIDLRQGKHMAGVLIYRGAAKPADIDQALNSMRERGRVQFVDWAPSSFKTGLSELPPLAVPDSGIAGMPLSVTLISNHSAVASLFQGQSAAVKKLVAAGSCFLRSYESSAANSADADTGADSGSGSLSASHNSGVGIVGLLKEASDHLEGLAELYASEQPPNRQRGQPDAAMDEDEPAGHRQVMPLSPKQKAAAAERRREGLFPIGPARSGRIRQDEEPPATSSTEHMERGQQEAPSSYTAAPDSEQLLEEGGAQQPWAPSSSEGSLKYGTTTEHLPATGDKVAYTQQSTGSGTNERLGPQQMHLGSPGEEEALAPSEMEPESQFGTVTMQQSQDFGPAQNEKETVTIGRSEISDNLAAAPASPHDSTVTHGQQGTNTHTQSFSTPTADSEGATPQAAGQQQYSERSKSQQKKGGGGCCRKRGKEPPKRGGAQHRSQSQNHANSWGAKSSNYFVYSSGSSSQDDMLVGTRDSFSYLSHHSSTTHSFSFLPAKLTSVNARCEDAVDCESALSSGETTDSAADLDEIIRDCVPGPMPALTSVKKMVEKYNEMAANEP